MPNIKSAIKRVKVNEKSKLKNSAQKSALRTSIKNFEVAVHDNNIDKAKDSLNVATRKLDKAVSKGLIKKNTASRQKSRLTKKFNKLSKVETA